MKSETLQDSSVKQRIENYWSCRADDYDQSFGHGIFSEQEKLAWLKALEKNIACPKGSKILDVGCGTGFLALLLAELGYNVTGLDLSRKMMAEAEFKASSANLNITFQIGDAESPDIPAQSFHAVISRHLLWTLPHPAEALTNWKNILVPGGQIIVIDGVWTPRDTYSKVMYFISNLLMKLKGTAEHSGWDKEYMEKPDQLPLMGGAEPEKVLKLFNDAGLQQTRVDYLSEVISCEKKIASFEHRLKYTCGKTRYLVSGIAPLRE